MSVILETEENRDPREGVDFELPPPPPTPQPQAPEPAVPAQILGQPEFDPTNYPVPNPHIPQPPMEIEAQQAINEGQQEAEVGGTIEGENPQTGGGVQGSLLPQTIINPPPPGTFGGAQTGQQIDAAAAQVGVNQYANLLNQYTTEQDFHTSGEMFPTLYEGAPTTIQGSTLDYGLIQKSIEESRVQQNQINYQIAPQREKSGVEFRPDATGNPFTNGTIPGFMRGIIESGQNTLEGFTNPSNNFDPFKGFVDTWEEMKKNPWAAGTALLPMIPLINSVSKGQYGDYGDGVIGSILWGLSTAQSATAGAMTDMYQFFTGNKKPVGNKPNAAQAIFSGEDYSFTQRANEQHPLSVIGSKKAPRTIDDIKERSWLWRNPIVAPALEIAKLVTGNKLPQRVDFLPGEKFDFSVGRVYQFVEGTIGLGLDTVTDPFTYIPGANVVAAGNRIKNATETALQAVDPKAAQEIGQQLARNTPPPQIIIPPKPKAQPPGITVLQPNSVAKPTVSAPLSGLPNPAPSGRPVTALSSPSGSPTAIGNIPSNVPQSLSPLTIPALTGVPIHNSPPPANLIRSISTAPSGSTVVPDQLIHVVRSPEELTSVAKVRGETPISREKPLSRTRLNMIEQHVPGAEGVYRVYGSPVNLQAAGESIARSPAAQLPKPVDVPLPRDFQNSITELWQRTQYIKNAPTNTVTKVIAEGIEPDKNTLVQIAHEMDGLIDNVVGDIDDITEPAVLAQVQRAMPKEFATNSPEGIQALQELVRLDRAFNETADAVQQTSHALEQAVEEFAPILDELDELPDIGRRLINEPLEFTPSPTSMQRVADDVPAPLIEPQTYYHGSRVENLNLQAIDPVIGSARHEYGVGIYLSKNQDEALENAFAGTHRNLPETPDRVIGTEGVMYETVIAPRKVLAVTEPVPVGIANVLDSAVKNSGLEPDVIKKVTRLVKEEAPIKKVFDAINSSGEPEEILLNLQRAIAVGMREAGGIDALVDDDLLVVLNPAAIQNSSEVLRKTVENPVELAAYRYNAASRTDARTQGQFTSVAFKEARVDLQGKIVQQAEEIHNQVRELGDDMAHRLLEAEENVAETVKIEQARIKQQRYEKNYKKDMLENEHLQNKKEGWCL